MVDATTLGVVVLLLLVQGIVLYFVLRPRRGLAAAKAPAPRRLVIPGGMRLSGRVEIRADVVLAAAASRGQGRGIELDVPTEHVDDVLRAFRQVGFEARDTGVTVDTDEGEETLTTLLLEMTSLTRKIQDPSSGGTLVVDGNVTVEPEAEVDYHLEVFGEVEAGDGAVLRGNLRADGDITLGNRVRIDGDVQAARDVEVGTDTRAKSIRSRGEVRLAAGFPGMERVVQAARVTVRPSREPRGQGA